MSWMIVVEMLRGAETDSSSIWVSSNRALGQLAVPLSQRAASGVNVRISHVPSAHPPAPCTASPAACCHMSRLLRIRNSLRSRRYAYVLLCYLAVDVHVSQADAELPGTSDDSTVSGCALPLQLQDGAHVLQQGGLLHTEQVSLPCHTQLVLNLCPAGR